MAELKIHTKRPLPERAGGWNGYRGVSPLWYGPVELELGETLHLLTGSDLDVVTLAEDYASALVRLTGGTIVDEEDEEIESHPTPSSDTVADLEARLLKLDLRYLEELARGNHHLRSLRLDGPSYLAAFGRRKPVLKPEPSNIYATAHEVPAALWVPGIVVTPLHAWVRDDRNLLEPIAEAARYAPGLLPRLRFIVSQFDGPGTEQAFDALIAVGDMEDCVDVHLPVPVR